MQIDCGLCRNFTFESLTASTICQHCNVQWEPVHAVEQQAARSKFIIRAAVAEYFILLISVMRCVIRDSRTFYVGCNGKPRMIGEQKFSVVLLMPDTIFAGLYRDAKHTSASQYRSSASITCSELLFKLKNSSKAESLIQLRKKNSITKPWIWIWVEFASVKLRWVTIWRIQVWKVLCCCLVSVWQAGSSPAYRMPFLCYWCGFINK